MRMLEEQKQKITHINNTIDLEIVLKHDPEQSRSMNNAMSKRIRMSTNRDITLVHLAIVICYKNQIKEDEWPNFEFFPCLQTNSVKEDQLKKLMLNGNVRAFPFRSTAKELLTLMCPGEEDKVKKLELNYKKKPMP